MLMGKTYAEFGPNLKSDQFVLVRGRVSLRDEAKNINAQRIELIDAGLEDSAPVVLNVRDFTATRTALEDLDRTLRNYPGQSEVFINMIDGARNASRFKLQHLVKLSVPMIAEIKSIFGSKVFVGGDELLDVSGGLVGTLVIDQGISLGSDEPVFDFNNNDGI